MKTQWLALAALSGMLALAPVVQADDSCDNVAGTYSIVNDQQKIKLSGKGCGDTGTFYFYVDGSFTVTQEGCTLTLADVSGSGGFDGSSETKYMDIWEADGVLTTAKNGVDANLGPLTATLKSSGKAVFEKEVEQEINGAEAEGSGKCTVKFNKETISCSFKSKNDAGKTCKLSISGTFTGPN